MPKCTGENAMIGKALPAKIWLVVQLLRALAPFQENRWQPWFVPMWQSIVQHLDSLFLCTIKVSIQTVGLDAPGFPYHSCTAVPDKVFCLPSLAAVFQFFHNLFPHPPICNYISQENLKWEPSPLPDQIVCVWDEDSRCRLRLWPQGVWSCSRLGLLMEWGKNRYTWANYVIKIMSSMALAMAAVTLSPSDHVQDVPVADGISCKATHTQTHTHTPLITYYLNLVLLF